MKNMEREIVHPRDEPYTRPEPLRCPACEGADVDRLHHAPTFALPECDYWQCMECEHEWGHG